MTFGRGWHLGALVLLGVLLTPRDSFAIWGWIEQFSGPGPFRTMAPASIRTTTGARRDSQRSVQRWSRRCRRGISRRYHQRANRETKVTSG